ncbi:hypothetical protein Tco_1561565, partial [Tanacetum coccineum]
MSGLKTCSANFSLLDESRNPEMVDPYASMVDPSRAVSADGLTKLMGLVPLVDALLLSNPKPILQLDELRHTDNTTLIPPRLPDILPRRTARISVLPIEPNLAERARISAINLDDYQLDPVTPPPSPSSPFTMAAYQRMIAETDPTQREEALTETEELEAFMTLWDVKPRVEESSLETLSVDELITQLRQMCEYAEDRTSNAQEEARHKRKEALKEVILNQLIATRVAEALAAVAVTHAASTQEEYNLGSNSSQNKTCNYKEFRAVMHENFRGTEGAVGLTRWFEKLESEFGISNVVEGDRVKFASSILLDGALTWWNVYVHSVTLDTAHA